jgi:prevent-host-death family protein
VSVDAAGANDYNGHMTTAGIADLKARLSGYLDQVKGGNEVLVTDRGVPVARLVPVEPKDKRSGRDEELIRADLLIPGRGRLPVSMRRPPKGDPKTGAEVLAALLAERGEGR